MKSVLDSCHEDAWPAFFLAQTETVSAVLGGPNFNKAYFLTGLPNRNDDSLWDGGRIGISIQFEGNKFYFYVLYSKNFKGVKMNLNLYTMF
jgi:hypothetical protein